MAANAATLAHAVASLQACAGTTGSPQGYGLALLQGGAVHACNGALYGRAPCHQLPATLPPTLVPYTLLLAAAQALPAAPTIAQAGARLRITSGAFSARLPALPGSECGWLPDTLDAPAIYMPPNMRRGLQLCAAFMETGGNDWTCGVRIQDGFVLATDRNAAIRAPGTGSIAKPLAHATLPAATVTEINKRTLGLPNEELPGISLTPTHATFHFADGTLLRSSLIAGAWPRSPEDLFAPIQAAQLAPVPSGLLEAVRNVTPFCVPQSRPLLRLQPRGAVVASIEAYGEEDACVDGFAPNQLTGTWRADHLGASLEIAKYIQFTETRCCWRGDEGVEGMIMSTRG